MHTPLTSPNEQSVARGIPGFPKNLLPFPSETTFDVSDTSIDVVSDRVDAELSALPLRWHWNKGLSTGVGFAGGNVWSRQARRKMRGTGTGKDPASSSSSVAPGKPEEIDEDQAALGFKIQLKLDVVGQGKKVLVRMRWLKGTDTVLFESFCGMLKRKTEGR